MSEAWLKKLSMAALVITMLPGLLAAGASAATSLNDPTRPPAAQVAKSHKVMRKSPRWTLSSILVSAQRRSAVINDQVVGVGEKINGARVLVIEPGRVLLRRNGRDITLVLLKKTVKQPSRHGSGKP